MLGPENETAPPVAGTILAVGLIDAAASETKLFNGDCMSVHSKHRGGRIQPTRTYAGLSAGSVTCWIPVEVEAAAEDDSAAEDSTLEAEVVAAGVDSARGEGLVTAAAEAYS